MGIRVQSMAERADAPARGKPTNSTMSENALRYSKKKPQGNPLMLMMMRRRMKKKMMMLK
jgi:hypothetical protein